MNSSDFTDIPNPFASASMGRQHPRRRAAKAALKFFLLIGVCSAMVLGISIGGKQFLLNRLTANFDSLGSIEKQNRLAQLAQFGPAAIGVLTEAMLCDDIDVARTAYDLLCDLQNDWTVLSLSVQQSRHAQLVEAVRGIAIQLPDDRTGWASTLLQQTISEIVQRRDADSRALYVNANKTLAMLTLADRSGPSVLADEPLDPLKPSRLMVQSQPLPLDAIVSQEPVDEVREDPPPSIYRSASSRLQTVAPETTIVLRDVAADTSPTVESRETSFQVNQVQSTQPLVDSAMAAYDDPSVMTWLSSDHENLRQQAKLELMSRGYDERELSLADRIAKADVPARLELVDMISREPSIDPRPWLWMMSRDPHRDVRLRVISVVATMNDPGARRHLQDLLADERDPVAAARIRRVLQ